MYFIITVDTEGDNLWSSGMNDAVSVRNAQFVPRFQELCETYGFKPVYLTNYEMISSDDFASYVRPKAQAGLCEVGIHVHAWNTPPLCELIGDHDGLPYLIEYPSDVMRAKFKTTYDLITQKIGRAPVSHRAGRWWMNDDYFALLEEFGIKVDCSHTPGISWAKSCGTTVDHGPDYSGVKSRPSMIGQVLEVPVTVRYRRHYLSFKTLRHCARTLVSGDYQWMRPSFSSFTDMKNLSRIVAKEGSDYIEFMIHSSEFMPGGSPYYPDGKSVDSLFKEMSRLFSCLSDSGCIGVTLEEYANHHNNKAGR